MEIEALWDQPGLVAFECPDCEYLASVIVTLRQRLAQRHRMSRPLVAEGGVADSKQPVRHGNRHEGQ